MATKTHGHHHPSSLSHNGNAALVEHLAAHGGQVDDAERLKLIKASAYGLWEQAGKPDGDSERERFWTEAEKKVLAPGLNVIDGDDGRLMAMSSLGMLYQFRRGQMAN